MSGLIVGLAVGFAVAGGTAAVSLSIAGDVAGGLLGAVVRDPNLMKSRSRPVRDGLTGAFVGAVAGGLLGYGIETGAALINGTPTTPAANNAPVTLVQNCRDQAAPGDSIVFEQNAQGQPTCRVVKAPAPQQ